MRTLVPIRLKVGLKEQTGHAKYPNFNLISSGIRKGMDWSHYIDTHGIGLHYDKTCGHKEESAESPFGQQWACMCVPADFAQQAVAIFPDTVSIISEVEFEDFYDNKAHAHESDEHIDTDVLEKIKAKEAMGVAVPEKAAAIDPLNSARGIRKNTNKKWADAKIKMGVNIA